MPIDTKKIWQEVKVNAKRLDDCVGPHEFVPVEPRKFGGRFRCRKCGGTLDGVARIWYERGLVHGKKK